MSKNKVKKKRHRFLKAIGITFLALLIAAITFVVVVIMKAPSLSLLDAEPDGYRTTVLDDEENVVLTLTGQEANRVYVKLDQIPENLQHAFVAIEDERFYTHHGVDIKGILRAFVKGVTTGHFSEGASTITQQLLKNNVFSSWTSEKTFLDKIERKIQEQYLALKLENQADKDWILENYLNTINLGGGNWGVYTAARYYFNKDVSELTLSECAVIAGITKNPTSYNPLKNPENNAARRETVLSNMLEQGYITEDEYNEALADNVYERIASIDHTSSSAEIMNYFEDALIYEVLDDLMEETSCTEEEAWERIYRGGLVIYSTENSSMQSIAEEEVNNLDHGGSDAQVSLVLMDNETGQVKAMVGGRGEKTASLIMNRAITSVRQPGSSIKIIGEYAAGLENNLFTLGTTVDDAPYTYSNGTEIHNSDAIYRGQTTVDEAITVSDNVVALKCFQESGINTVYNMIENFGITTLDDSDKVEALALGGTTNGVTNLQMTAAYSTIARGGTYEEPIYYTKVLDREGNVVLENKQASHQVISSGTAALLTSAMENVITSGTGVDAKFDGMAIAGKSGTTTDVKDAWFIGYSPYLTCGVWGGYDDNSAQESSGYVKTIWKAVMSRVNSSYENTGFAQTDKLVEAKICTKCGNLAKDGLCDSTLQGDETRTEYYVSGTQPTTSCTCHVSVSICGTSGMKANKYCPVSSRETKVYLKEGTAGTQDEAYVEPNLEECTTHKSFIDKIFGGNSENSTNSKDDTESSSGSSSESSSSSSESSEISKPEESSGSTIPDGKEDSSDDSKNESHWYDWFTNLW